MRYGRLDRRIVIQRKTQTLDAYGSPVETWTELSTRWAALTPVNGDERFSTPEINASQQVEFLVRWSSSIADLTPQDRILYPVPSGDSPEIPDASVYDLVAVHEVGRREALRIIATRQPDLQG